MSYDITVISNGGLVIEVSVGEGQAILDAIDTKLGLGGGTLTGNLNTGGHRIEGLANPDSPDDAFPLSYGDSRYLRSDGVSVNVSGKRVEGLAYPDSDDDAVSRGYAGFTYLRLDGGNAMTALLSMNGHRIEAVADPDSSDDALNRGYADGRYLRGDGISINVGGKRVEGLAAPDSPDDATPRVYVDAAVQGVNDTLAATNAAVVARFEAVEASVQAANDTAAETDAAVVGRFEAAEASIQSTNDSLAATNEAVVARFEADEVLLNHTAESLAETQAAIGPRFDAVEELLNATAASLAGLTGIAMLASDAVSAHLRDGRTIPVSVPGWGATAMAQAGNAVSYARAPGAAYTGDPGGIVDESLASIALPAGITKIEFWPFIGQSYFAGYYSATGTVITNTAVRPDRVRMFSHGTRLEFYEAVQSPTHVTPPIPIGWLDTLVDAKERLATEYPGYQPSETPCSGFAYALTEPGMTPSTTLIVVASLAIGSAAIEHLSPGSTGYANLLRVAQRLRVIADIAGVTLEIPEVQFGEGASNYLTTYASYRSMLDALQAQAEIDLKAIAGQSTGIPFGLIQACDFAYPYAPPRAQLDLAIQYPARFRMGPPMYQYPYTSEAATVHLTPQGNRNMGEDMGRAAARRRYGSVAQTQLYLSAAVRSGNVITATVAGAQGALGTSGAVTDPGNKGITFAQTGGNSVTVASVTISGTTLTVTLSAVPTGTSPILIVGGTSSFSGTGNGLGGGPTAGPRSPIHDSAGTVRADGSTANKYLALQNIAVT